MQGWSRSAETMAGWLTVLALWFSGLPAAMGHGYVEAAPGVNTLQGAVDALPAGGGTVHLEDGDYTLTNTLNLAGKQYVELAGQRGATIVIQTGAQPGIDLTDARDISLENLEMTSSGNITNAGLLLGSTAATPGASRLTFRNVRVAGIFSVAALYAANVSGCEFYNCDFINSSTEGDGVAIAGTNYAGVSSPYRGSLAAGPGGDMTFHGCNWMMWISATNATPCNAIRLSGPVTDVRARGCYFSVKAPGNHGVRLDTAGGAIDRIVIDGLRSESEGSANFLKTYGAGTVRHVALRDSMLSSAGGPVVDASSLPGTEEWDIWGNWLFGYTTSGGGTNLCSFANLSYSRIDVRRFSLYGARPWFPARMANATNVEFYAQYTDDVVVTGSQTACDVRTSGTVRP